MNNEEKEYLKEKWWIVCTEWDNRVIISSMNTFDTLFFMQSLWWHLNKIEEDDIRDKDMWRVERNLLYYYK